MEERDLEMEEVVEVEVRDCQYEVQIMQLLKMFIFFLSKAVELEAVAVDVAGAVVVGDKDVV